MKLFAAFALFLGTLCYGQDFPVFASVVPASPVYRQAPHLDRVQWSLLAADAGVRALDTYSTRRMLQGPNHEKFLPDCIAHSTVNLAAFEGGALVADYIGVRYLVRHHHARWAKVLTTVDVGMVAPWAIHNLALPSGTGVQLSLPHRIGRIAGR